MIKKRFNWTQDHPPHPPSEPTPPAEEFEDDDLQMIHTAYLTIDMSGLLPLPEGVDFSNLRIMAGSEDELEVYVVSKKMVKNHNYDRQYDHYLKKMNKWKSMMKKHAAEVELWKLWKEQEDQKTKAAELSKAASILKKYGIPFPNIGD